MPPRRIRCILATIAATVLAGASVVLVEVSPASACDNNNHCYGTAWSNPSGIIGLAADISPSCMRAPNQTFTTDELWLEDSSAVNWVEAGWLNQGTNLSIGGNTTAGIFGFYADSRPGGGFHAHILEVGPPTGTFKHVAINKTASNTYYGGFDGHQGLSTGNSMTPTVGQWGSETNGNTTAGYSWVRNTQYFSNGSWHSGTGPDFSVEVDNNQNFSWISQPNSYNAGPSC